MIRKAAHNKVSRNDYWWSGYNDFSQIIKFCREQIGLDMEQFFNILHAGYKFASALLHASCYGNMNRIDYDSDSFAGIDTSPKIDEVRIPLDFTCKLLIYIVCNICQELNVDYHYYKESLNDLAIYYGKVSN
jgi:hypothetical protein